MLTGARDGGFGGSLGVCFLFTHPLCHVCLLREVEQLLLFFSTERYAEQSISSTPSSLAACIISRMAGAARLSIS